MGNNAQNPVDDESDMQVTLSLDDGSEVECAILTIFELEEQNYIALLPLDEDGNENEEGEVFIYRYFEDEEGNPSLENIEDDEEYEAVADRFDELLDEAAYEDFDLILIKETFIKNGIPDDPESRLFYILFYIALYILSSFFFYCLLCCFFIYPLFSCLCSPRFCDKTGNL